MARILVSLLWIVGGLIAVVGAYRNELRASSCLDWGFNWTPEDALFGLVPPLIAVAVTLATGRSIPLRVGSMVTALVWVVMAADSAIDDEIKQYSPCDRKGDESTQFLYFGLFFFGPMIWAGVSTATAVSLLLYRAYLNHRCNKER